LQKLGVSSPELERLIATARHAGALGAKLSGGGRGGNIIALVDESSAPGVAESLGEAGARGVILTTVQ
jgi:mevalonate kinase